MGIVTGYLSQLVSSGIKLLVGGSAVSSSNPLPIVFSTATSTSRSGLIGMELQQLSLLRLKAQIT